MMHEAADVYRKGRQSSISRMRDPARRHIPVHQAGVAAPVLPVRIAL